MAQHPNQLKYNIMTLKASELIKDYATVKESSGNVRILYKFDLSVPSQRQRFIKSISLYEDTALFYQIRQILENEENLIWNQESLKETLIFVDFEFLFDKLKESDAKALSDYYSKKDLDSKSKRIDDEYRLQEMFRTGIEIKFSEQKVVHFIPFDKSNSMSRQSKISMVDERLVKNLEQRLNLELSIPQTNLSKYYSYRGLYLTSAKRVDCASRLLDCGSVVVIPDKAVTLGNQRIVTAEETNKKQHWNILEKDLKIKIEKVFDGEGLISPTFSEYINTELYKNEKATSFQIRMPFAKGMLHQVDFHKFIEEQIGKKVDSFIIRDVYGIERDLMKAQIIMTDGMFKCRKWLKQALTTADPMKYYFEMFHKYNHALYISGSDKDYKNSSVTRLNYQFLNTLALDNDDLGELVHEHQRYIEHPSEHLDLIDSSSSNYSMEEELDEQKVENYELWKYALKVNPVFAHETSIKKKLKGISYGLKQDIANGRILIKGEIRYLSRDLLAFLIDLLKLGDSIDADIINKLKKQLMFSNRFFLPKPLLKLEINKHYPILRNPHLSRNEQCLLVPYSKGKKKAKQDLYYQYFSHLSGVLMVPYRSLVPHILGGADFDGDIIKVFDDKRIREAVLKGGYEYYQRTLPVIQIPSVGANDQEVPEQIPFEVIKNTFSNKIGQLSNLSIKIGNLEYGQGEKPEHSCAECTILTGLEIDAAKNGEHPDLSDIISYGNAIKSKFDYVEYLKELNKVIDLSKNPYGIRAEQVKVGDNRKYKLKSYFGNDFVEYKADDSYRPIDQLPKYYMDLLKSEIDWPVPKKHGSSIIYFDFLENNDWKKSLDLSLQSEIKAVMLAYKKVKNYNRSIIEYRKNVGEKSYEGYVRSILKMQYDQKEYDAISQGPLVKLETEVYSRVETKEAADAAMEGLKDRQWAFLLPSQKKEALKSILNYEMEDELAEILCNFNEQGYKLLYYILKEVSLWLLQEKTDSQILEQQGEESLSSKGKKVDEKTYETFFPELRDKYLKWHEDGKRNCMKEILAECNQEIQKRLARVDEDQRLLLLWSLHADCDVVSVFGDFFWNNITAEDLRKHLRR